MVPFLCNTAWNRFTVECQLMSCTPPNGSVRLQVITARSSSSFRYRVPDILGLKKTLIAGVVLIRLRPACASSAKRSTEIPPPRPPLPATGSPKAIDPVTPTENEFHVLPENGNPRLFSAALLPLISDPNSGSH